VRYLLDTHTVLWFFEDSERLSEKAAAIIEGNQEQESIDISIASLWEWQQDKTEPSPFCRKKLRAAQKKEAPL
jgi:PIN domain nuclease of toxin-antitoxin system